MTDWLMKVFAPRGTWGFLWRLMVLTGNVALANFAFGRVIEDQLHSPSYYIGHAAFVGGPLIAFFLMVTVYQVRLQRKLLNLSRKDALTGLNNRGYFLESVEATRKTVEEALLTHCETLQDRFAVLAGAPTSDSNTTAASINTARKSEYGAVYFPWIDVSGSGALAPLPLTSIHGK